MIGLRRLIKQRHVKVEASIFVRSGDEANAKHSWLEAEQAYRKALTIDPSLREIWVQYGHALKEQGWLGQAEDAYRRSIKLSDHDADPHLQLGHVLKLQGHYKQALAAYQAALNRAPDLVDAHREIEALKLRHDAKLDRSLIEEVEHDQCLSFTADLVELQRQPGAYRGRLELGLRELLDHHRLSGAWLEMFDHQYYYYKNEPVRQAVLRPIRALCLIHFCEEGIETVLPIKEAVDFDPAFYKSTYLNDMPFTPANAYRHWLNFGLKQGYWPNQDRWLESNLGSGLSSKHTVDLVLYGASRDLPSNTRWADLMNDFIENIGVFRTPLKVTNENASFLVKIADRLAVAGLDERALYLYQRVLDVIPDHPTGFVHYADLLFRKECYLEAARLYNTLVHSPEPSIWSFINLAATLERLGKDSHALETLRKGRVKFPGDRGLQARFEEAATKALEQGWLSASILAKVGRLNEGRAHLHDVLKQIANITAPRDIVPHRYVKAVAIVGNQDLDQCRFYRIDQRIEQLNEAGFQVKFFDFRKDLAAFSSEIYAFDAAIFYRVPAYRDVMRAIQGAREGGVLTFYDIDDPIFDAEHYPPPIETYGGQVTLEEYNGLALGAPLFRRALALCEFGIASTPTLAERMRGIDGVRDVFVHRNALSYKHLQYVSRSRNQETSGRTIIFYGSGTKAHKQDFADLVEPALVEIVRRHGTSVVVILAGYVTISDRLAKISDNIILLDPIWDLDKYWSALALAHINIAVLEPSPLTNTKSEIKWLEAAMLGIPSVVSGTATYREIVQDGVDAFVCDTPSQWLEALEKLIRSAELRHSIGERARDKALSQYAPSSMASNLSKIIRGVSPRLADLRRHILIVNVFYPPQSIGGATRVVHDNVKDLNARHGSKFYFNVFTSIDGERDGYRTATHVHDGVRVTGVTTPDRPDIDHVIADDKMGQIFGEFLDRTQPRLIHFHCVQRLTVAVVDEAIKRKIPYILTMHDGWWISDDQFLLDKHDRINLYDYAHSLKVLNQFRQSSFSRMIQIQPALLGARKVLTVSKSFAKLCEQCGVPNVVAFPNGVSDINPVLRSSRQGNQVTLGFIGGLARHKGYHLLRYALLSQHFENLRFIVIDHAMHPGTFRHEVLGNTPVEYRAKTPQKEVASLFALLDVLVAPSVWPESFGLVTREAMLCGCWVVASDRGAIGEDIVEGKNGYIIDVSDSSSLIEVLHRIDADPLRHTVAPSEAPPSRFSFQQADELAALYISILDTTIVDAEVVV